MKKFFVSLLVALCGAASLYADDVGDVKAVIVRDCEFAAKGNFAASLALRTRDYRCTDSHGATFNYQQNKWMFLALDGQHPVEFWLYLYSVKHNGAMPPGDQLSRMNKLARTPRYVKLYEETWPALAAFAKIEAALELKTIKFIDVKTDGNEASVILEYDSNDPDFGAVLHKAETVSLRRVSGKWLMYRTVTKNK